MTRAMLVAALVAALAGGLGGGCGKKEITRPEEPPPPTPDAAAASLADSGWAHFVASDYAGALGFFQQAIAQQRAAGESGAPDYTDPLAGRGWTELRMDSLSAAAASFAAAVAGADYWRDYASHADALAGQAVIASKDGDYAAAAAAGASAVEAGGESYRLGFRPGRAGRVHDASFTVRHVRLIVAEAYVRQGLYDLAYDQLVGIDVTVLDRVNPESEHFVEDLLEEIATISQGLS